MATHTDWLPDDVQALRRLLQERDDEIAKLQQQNADLRHNVEVYRKMAFGPSSEKFRPKSTADVDAQQGWLFHETVVAEALETAERKQVDA